MDANQRIRYFVKLFTPPIILVLTGRFRKTNVSKPLSNFGWFGDYSSWSEAINDAVGYNSTEILSKVSEATKKVLSGEGAYERDSILFQEVQYSWPLLASLEWVASQNNNSLSVVDFGGSLGSTYFQNRKFLKALDTLSWSVIEQPIFVEEGLIICKSESFLYFYRSFEECFKEQKPTVMLFSNVLNYLEDPYEMLNNAISYHVPYIILDVVGLIKEKVTSHLSVQSTGIPFSESSYPCWHFNEAELLGKFNEHYTLMESFQSYIGAGILINRELKTEYKGFLFVHK